MDSLGKLEQAAAAGDGEAQLACARAYIGFGIEKKMYLQSTADSKDGGFEQEIAEDFHTAFVWYQKAAAQGLADAVYELSLCYEEGEGTEPNPEKAQELLEQAARLGDTEAEFRLGMQAYEGYTIVRAQAEQDFEKAVFWLKKAAAKRDSFAQYYLGLCYENGTGVEQDLQKAVALYRRSAECECPQAEAVYALARCREYGLGVEKDMRRAFELYQKAAEDGDVRANVRLGEWYEKGIFVEKDKQSAIEWYNTAAEQGDEDAISALYRLSS